MIVSVAPDDTLALEAHRGLGRSAAGLKDRAAMQSAVAAIRGSLSGLPRAAFSQFEIGKQCRKAGWNEDAFALWRDVTARWPGDSYAFWAQVALATENAALGNEVVAAADIERLFSVFRDHSQLPGRINRLAKEYMDKQGSAKALALSGRVLETWPDHAEAIWAQAHLVEANARLGNAAAANEAAAVLLDRYGGDPRLPNVYYQIAHRLFKGGDLPHVPAGPERRSRLKSNSAAARPYLETFLERWPNDSNALSAWSETALARLYADDEAGEDAAVETMLANFAGHHRLYPALLRVAEQRVERAKEKISNEERNRRFKRADRLLACIRDGNPDPADLDANPRACFLLAYSTYHQQDDAECVRLCEESFLRWPEYRKHHDARILASSAYITLANRGTITLDEATAAVQRLYDAQAADTKAPDPYYREEIEKSLLILQRKR